MSSARSRETRHPSRAVLRPRRDAEYEAGLAKAREIRDGLASLGWTEPVLINSGNGAQLMCRVDLPTNNGGVIQRVLTEVAKASSDTVKIDLAVHNAA